MEDKDIDNLLEEFPLTNENIDYWMMTYNWMLRGAELL